MRTGLGACLLRVVSAAMLASMFVACGDDAPEADETSPIDVASTTAAATTAAATTEPAPTASASTTSTATTSATTGPDPTAPESTAGDDAPDDLMRVGVYWAWSIPTSAGTPERLGAGARSVAVDDRYSAAVAALLGGPDEAEQEIGMETAIPAGTVVHGVDVDDGLAAVDLSDSFTESSGSLAEVTRLAQVVFTLTAFDEVDRVVFAIDGERRDPILSHGFVVGDGFDRDSFAEVRPFILVEAPTPGEVVDGTVLTVTGESNTFEATVRWELVDDAGNVVDEDFTMATGGMGIWGEFSFTADLTALDGSGAVVVFETSPRDGSRQNVVEVPFLTE